MTYSGLELGINNVQRKLQALKERFDSIEKEIKRLEQEHKYITHAPIKKLEGNMVWKLTRCNKPECTLCPYTTKNPHGPYPHIQWRNKKGKLKTIYVSMDNYRHYLERIQFTQRVKQIEVLLVKKEQEKQQIEQTLNDLVYRLDV